jgi:hypothetical protein
VRRSLLWLTGLVDVICFRFTSTFTRPFHDNRGRVHGRGQSTQRSRVELWATPAYNMATPSPSPTPRPIRTSEPDLFFGSDSEDDAPVAQSGPSSPVKLDLEPSPSMSRQARPNVGIKRATSADSDIVAVDTKPPVAPSNAGPSVPTRKRPSVSRSPSGSIPPSFTGGYLGEFVCEGWSLSKGKGYCVPGSKVIFERPKPTKAAENGKTVMSSGAKAGPTKLVNGKVVNGKGKPVGKQMTLGSMGLGKKAATAVRFAACITDETAEQEDASQSRSGPDHPFQVSRAAFARAPANLLGTREVLVSTTWIM